MFEIINELGPASWHNISKNEDEEKALNYVAQLQYETYQLKPEQDLLKIGEHLWSYGKKLFREKHFSQAEYMFTHAILCFPSGILYYEKLSILHQNIAICQLKMDLPILALSTLSISLLHNYDNKKAHLLTIKTLYVVYDFEQAMRLVNYGLFSHAVLEDLILFKKKLTTNKVREKFSTTIINQRISKYNSIESAISMKPPMIDISSLLQSLLINNINAFTSEAKIVMDQVITCMGYLLGKKNFYEAHQAAVDLYYIICTLRSFPERDNNDDNDILFQIFSTRAMCLYYMERYEEALECHHKAATMGHLMNVEDLTLEAKILLKLNKFDKALETINRCIDVAKPYSVEALICEEVLFEINFEKDSHICSTAKMPKDIEGIPRENNKEKEETFAGESHPQEIVPKSATESLKEEDAEYLVKVCSLCGALVPEPWVEHVKTERHTKLSRRQNGNNNNNGVKTQEASTQTEDILYNFAKALEKYKTMPFSF